MEQIEELKKILAKYKKYRIAEFDPDDEVKEICDLFQPVPSSKQVEWLAFRIAKLFHPRYGRLTLDEFKADYSVEWNAFLNEARSVLQHLAPQADGELREKIAEAFKLARFHQYYNDANEFADQILALVNQEAK